MYSLEIYHPVVFYHHTFGFQEVLHNQRATKAVLTREHARPIDNSVGGNVGHCVGVAHGPSNHSRGRAATQIPANYAVRRHSAWWNQAHNGVNVRKKIFV